MSSDVTALDAQYDNEPTLDSETTEDIEIDYNVDDSEGSADIEEEEAGHISCLIWSCHA